MNAAEKIFNRRLGETLPRCLFQTFTVVRAISVTIREKSKLAELENNYFYRFDGSAI